MNLGVYITKYTLRHTWRANVNQEKPIYCQYVQSGTICCGVLVLQQSVDKIELE